MDNLEEQLLRQARSLGFDLVGIAAAQPADHFDSFAAWLDQGHAGEMGYLHKHRDARRHPTSMLPSVRSVIMVAMTYSPEIPLSRKPFPARLARYARGPDYHDVIRTKLKELANWLVEVRPEARGRAVVDTAPLLERDFARRAGLGWFGKNTMLIHPRLGSYFLLGALLTDVELQPTPSFDRRHCGSCTACLDACPTQAFVSPGVLDARRCISYLTIELKSAIPKDQRPDVDNWLFGCDICQEVCPWNRKAVPGNLLLAPRENLLALDACEILQLSPQAFAERFRGTALHPRPGRPAVLRNAAIILGNTGTVDALPSLRIAREDHEPLIREAAEWAIARIESRSGNGSS